jgi:mRNA interferase ChpB
MMYPGLASSAKFSRPAGLNSYFRPNAGFSGSLAEAGTRTQGVIRCDQRRPVDIAARSGHRLGSIPQHILEDVLAKLLTLFT